MQIRTSLERPHISEGSPEALVELTARPTRTGEFLYSLTAYRCYLSPVLLDGSAIFHVHEQDGYRRNMPWGGLGETTRSGIIALDSLNENGTASRHSVCREKYVTLLPHPGITVFCILS